MASGILRGMIVGTLVAGVGASGLSLLIGPPASGPAPVTNAADAPTGQGAPVINADSSIKATDTQQPAVTSQSPRVEAPEPDASAIDGDQTASVPAPDTSAAVDPIETPAETSEPVIAGLEDVPATKPDMQAAPDAPEGEAEVSVATDSATPQSTAPEAEAEPVEPVAAVPDAEREEIVLNIAPEEPETVVVVTPRPESSAIGKPATTLGSSASGRLPTVQAEAGQGTDNAVSPSADAPPFKRFAQAFKGDVSKPRMAIVLIDDGTSNIGIEALTTFPYPLSFAVDTSWRGAKDAMAVYRASGFEVLAMVDLPRGARASDVEVALPVLLDTVPEAVGVMETPDAGLQDSQEVSKQVSEYLSNSGHGLLLFSKGLNTARKLAEKEGVPSATVFRDFDLQGQNASAIKRFLDHAALKASSEGGVVMVGRLRADTISALLLWGLQDRSDRLELAPISQLLNTQN